MTQFYPPVIPTNDPLTPEDLYKAGIIPFCSTNEELNAVPHELLEKHITSFHFEDGVRALIEARKPKKVPYISQKSIMDMEFDLNGDDVLSKPLVYNLPKAHKVPLNEKYKSNSSKCDALFEEKKENSSD